MYLCLQTNYCCYTRVRYTVWALIKGIELYWRDAHKCPSEAEYISMVLNSKFTSNARNRRITEIERKTNDDSVEME